MSAASDQKQVHKTVAASPHVLASATTTAPPTDANTRRGVHCMDSPPPPPPLPRRAHTSK
jgi:hypothetical protein